MHGLAIVWTGLVGVLMCIFGIWNIVEYNQFTHGIGMIFSAGLCVAMAVMLSKKRY